MDGNRSPSLGASISHLSTLSQEDLSIERLSGDVWSSKTRSKQSYDNPIVLRQTSAYMYLAANQFLRFAVDSAEINFPLDWLKESVEIEALVDGLLTETKVFFSKNPNFNDLLLLIIVLFECINIEKKKRFPTPHDLLWFLSIRSDRDSSSRETHFHSRDYQKNIMG